MIWTCPVSSTEEEMNAVSRKQPSAAIRFTKSELRLLYADFETSIGCGAEDPDYVTIRDKVVAALVKLEVAEIQAEQKRN